MFLMAPPPTEREAYVASADGAAVIGVEALLRPGQGPRAAPARRSTGRSTPRGRPASSPPSTPAATAPRRCADVDGAVARHPRARRQPDHARAAATLTAEAIPGANLLLLADMGHDLPEPLWPLIVDAVITHTDFATTLARATTA